MKVRQHGCGLPKELGKLPGADRALAIYHIKVSAGSRLWLGVLIFPNRWDLQRFWRVGLKRGPLGRDCIGAFNCMSTEAVEFDENGCETDRWWEVDKRYFGILGLAATHLGVEVVSHECGHAAIAYAQRRNGHPVFAKPGDLPEEEICYPLGRIYSRLNRLLFSSGLYDRYDAYWKRQGNSRIARR